MKHIEVAYELLSEARRAREAYRNFPNQFELVKAHMYSIFESYAYGVIDWETTQKKWYRSIKEYLSLYKGNRQKYLAESAHMLDEYERALREYKPALDEFKRVSEQKMVSTLVVKKQLSESFAQKKSEFYYNKRCLNEAELKDITRLKSWTRVKENYPHLTDNDEDRLRFLTVFEAPTVKTTQLINMLSEYGAKPLTQEGKYAKKKKKKKVKEAAPTTSVRPVARPTSNIGRTEMSRSGVMSGSTRGIDQMPEPMPGPGSVGTTEISPSGVMSGSTRGTNQMRRSTTTAPTSSIRPQTRPAGIAQRGAINNAVRDAMGESVNLDQALDAIDKNFSPERTQIQDTAITYGRAAQMIEKGKTQAAMKLLKSNGFDIDDVAALKQAVQNLLRSETELKNREEVYRFSATPNIRSLKKALSRLEGGEKFNETTTAGGIAAVSQPLGSIQRRNPTGKKKVKEQEYSTPIRPANATPVSSFKGRPQRPGQAPSDAAINQMLDAPSSNTSSVSRPTVNTPQVGGPRTGLASMPSASARTAANTAGMTSGRYNTPIYPTNATPTSSFKGSPQRPGQQRSDAELNALFQSADNNIRETQAKKGVDGKRCWKGKKIHPTKPTKIKGGKRVDNCIDAGKK